MTEDKQIKIQVLTGTRADFGLLRNLMTRLDSHPEFSLETIVTGTHFSDEFGETWHEILASGLSITHRIDMLSASDTEAGVASSTGLAIMKFSELFDRERPDLLVILGDRFEALAGAVAAFLMRIPIAHIAGGEKTEGALDDSLRHAITKLSSLHFVAAEEYAKRVRQLGETPETVFNVGAIGFDSINSLTLLNRDELSKMIDFDITASPFFLCTMHPETTGESDIASFFAPLAESLDRFRRFKVLVTKANADSGGRQLNELWDRYAASRPERVKVVASLGQRAYLSALEAAELVIGNSSSGIIEAPRLGTPTVNIGSRQQGRLRAPSILDAPNQETAIVPAIQSALEPEFKKMSSLKVSPYGEPGASKKIVQTILTTNVARLLPKSFQDIE